jgi:hypothetical protein
LASRPGCILLALIDVTYIWECIPAAASAEVQALTVAALALQLELNCPQTNEVITPMFNAEPWLKEDWSTAWNDA